MTDINVFELICAHVYRTSATPPDQPPSGSRPSCTEARLEGKTLFIGHAYDDTYSSIRDVRTFGPDVYTLDSRPVVGSSVDAQDARSRHLQVDFNDTEALRNGLTSLCHAPFKFDRIVFDYSVVKFWMMREGLSLLLEFLRPGGELVLTGADVAPGGMEVFPDRLPYMEWRHALPFWREEQEAGRIRELYRAMILRSDVDKTKTRLTYVGCLPPTIQSWILRGLGGSLDYLRMTETLVVTTRS